MTRKQHKPKRLSRKQQRELKRIQKVRPGLSLFIQQKASK